MYTIEEPKIQPIIGTDSVRLLDKYTAQIDDKLLSIDAGYTCDGASIPSILWPLLGHPLSSSNLPAALIHDALYATHLLSRAESDRILRDKLIDTGKNRIAAYTIWTGVRMFGFIAWRKDISHINASKLLITIKELS